MAPTVLAQKVGGLLYAQDDCSRALGIELLEIKPGFARMRMKIRADMVNGHKTAHGGMIFTLADSSFAYACNSHNRRAVAAGCSIEFLRAAQSGEILTATGVEQSIIGRHGIYDVRVENQDGETVALFRGKSTRIKGQFIAEDGAGQ